MLFYGIWVLSGLLMLIYYTRRKNTFLSSIIGMGTGLMALLALHYFGGSIGYAPSLSLFNTATALILGVPGVLMMLFVNIFL